jgi:hypothetical protein
MPRQNKEWIGRSPDAQPPWAVIERLLAKANHKCQGPCGQPVGPGRPFDVDHIIELADGGENRESNLQILCRKICHAKKSGDRHADRSKERRVYRHLAGWKKRSRFRGWRRLDGTVVWADKRPEKKWVREVKVEDTAESWRHRALCLEAEVSARSASCDVKQLEIDHLEEGLREARIQIEELKRQLEFRRNAGNRSVTE